MKRKDIQEFLDFDWVFIRVKDGPELKHFQARSLKVSNESLLFKDKFDSLRIFSLDSILSISEWLPKNRKEEIGNEPAKPTKKTNE